MDGLLFRNILAILPIIIPMSGQAGTVTVEVFPGEEASTGKKTLGEQ